MQLNIHQVVLGQLFGLTSGGAVITTSLQSSHQFLQLHGLPHVAGDLQLPPLSTGLLRDAALQFKDRTGLGFDNVHPRRGACVTEEV